LTHDSKNKQNEFMKTEDTNMLPPEVMARLLDAGRRAVSGVRDPERMKQACERMDRRREEIFRKHGLLDIGVPAIREFRDDK